MRTIAIDGEHLTIEDVVTVAEATPGAVRVEVAPAARERVQRSRRAVEDFVARGEIV